MAGRSARRLVLVGPHPPPWGGIAVHVRALHQLAWRQGFAATVLDVGEGRGHGAGVRDAGSYGRFASELLRVAAAGGLLHAHIPGNNPKSWVVAAAASRALPGGLLTVHSGLAPALLERSTSTARLAWLACAGYARILCANGEIRAALERCGVEADRLQVLPAFVAAGLEPGQPPAAATTARTRSSLLLAAALAPGAQYGADVLLDALARAEGAACLIYGPGTADPAMAAALAARGLGDRVILLGEIDHPASLAVVALADAFIRPTRADGDSISVREALALGVRVIASDAGHRPSGVIRFPAGDAAALADAIRTALSSPPPSPAVDDEAPTLVRAWRSLGLQPASEEIRP